MKVVKLNNVIFILHLAGINAFVDVLDPLLLFILAHGARIALCDLTRFFCGEVVRIALTRRLFYIAPVGAFGLSCIAFFE